MGLVVRSSERPPAILQLPEGLFDDTPGVPMAPRELLGIDLVFQSLELGSNPLL